MNKTEYKKLVDSALEPLSLDPGEVLRITLEPGRIEVVTMVDMRTLKVKVTTLDLKHEEFVEVDSYERIDLEARDIRDSLRESNEVTNGVIWRGDTE